MTVQFVVGLIDILLFQEHNQSSSITSLIISIFSLPISLINSNLPFYVPEDLYMIVLYWILNGIIQAMILYGVFKVLKRLKNREWS